MKTFSLALLLYGTFALGRVDSPAVFLADHPGACPHCAPHVGTPQQTDTFRKACPGVRITSILSEADFLIVWDSKTWDQTSWGGHQQEYVIYNQAGDVIASGNSHRISSPAKDICKLVTKEAAKLPKEAH